jgi:hypothetical protein
VTRRWYLASLVPMLFGVIIGVLTLLSAYVNVKDMPRLVAPGEKTIHFDGGMYLLYGEHASFVDGTAYHTDELSVRCTLRDAAGASVAVEPPRSVTSYRFPTFEGSAVFQMSITRPGDYTLACDTGSQAHVVVAIGRNIRITLIIGLVAFLAGIAGALVALVVVWGRRKRALPTAQVTTGS